MADRRSNRLPERFRPDDVAGSNLSDGMYVGIVKANYDSARSGRIRVWIPQRGGVEDDPTSWIQMQYASPYAGTTYDKPGPNGAPGSIENSFGKVVHSYGMWAVIPDLGNTVLCTIIQNKGYWFACVNPYLSHYMTPGLASSKNLDQDTLQDKSLPPKYLETSNWPAAEFNQNSVTNTNAKNFINLPKPVHEFQANVLIQQGLDRDTIRGAISSSSQRESPSMVFGISTPGRPLNDPANDATYLTKAREGTLTQDDITEVTTRKGGHTFVMDDGDLTGGTDQLIRLRTAGGHQLLMNDSERVIYIANSDGSAYMEFTGEGKVYVYSSSGIHLRTDGDFNVHSGKDINFNSEGSINLKSTNKIAFQSKDHLIKTTGIFGIDSSKVNILSSGEVNLQGSGINAAASGRLVLKGDKIFLNTETPAAVSKVNEIRTYKHPDTSWNSTKEMWIEQADVFESIVSTAPAHEPWTRGPVGAAPRLEKQTSACSPENTSATPSTIQAVPGGGAGPFGDYIAQFESGRVGYNAFNRGSSPPPGTGSPREAMNLVDMSIADIQSLQNENDRNKKLFAVGRYQLITSTLAEAKSVLKISASAKFDNSVQDNMFLNYLCKGKRPQINAYLTNPNQFDDTLLTAAVVAAAREWASLQAPVGRNGPNTGFYDGMGTNKAHATVGDTKLALQAQWKLLKDNNGNPPAVTDGSGNAVVDGSGNAVQTKSNLDAGIASAKGKSVINPASLETMRRQGMPSPSAISSSTSVIPGLLATQVKALMIQIGFDASKLDYQFKDTVKNKAGLYGMNAKVLAEFKYIKSDYVAQYGAASIFRNDAWTGLDGMKNIDTFLQANGVQDAIMEKIIVAYYGRLVQIQSIKVGDDVCAVAGMIATAYFYRELDTVTTAKLWRQSSGSPSNGIAGEQPFNQGRYAVDVLSVAPIAAAPDASTYQPSTVGINPADVFDFGSGSGTRANFEAMAADFKDRMLQAAKEFKEKVGRKVRFTSGARTQEYQRELYDRWIKAGGGPSRPTAGGITTPSTGISDHTLGVASDISPQDLNEMKSLGLLSKYGLSPLAGDPPHILLKPSLRPANLPSITKI